MLRALILWAILCETVTAKSVTLSESCSYRLNDRNGDVNPMIINLNDEIVYPTDRTMVFQNGETFALYCHSTERSHNYFDNVGMSDEAENNIDWVQVTCRDGEFDIGTVSTFDIYGVTCKMRIQPRITKPAKFKIDSMCKVFNEEVPCANTGADGRTDMLVGALHTVEIGFQIRNNYDKMIEVCIDEKAYGTLWTKHFVYGVSIYENDYNVRPDFKVDNYNENRYFNFTDDYGMNQLYSINHQDEVVNRILGTDNLPDGTEIIVTGDNKHSWNRGHISPDADFVMDYQQDATYFFINIAPQFGAFNQKNWARVESACRSKSHYLRQTTTVTSGTFGSLDYPDLNGHNRDLWINWQPDQDVARVPVPKYYWKVLYDPASHSDPANDNDTVLVNKGRRVSSRSPLLARAFKEVMSNETEETRFKTFVKSLQLTVKLDSDHTCSLLAVAFLGLNNIYSADVTETACPSVCDRLTVWMHADFEAGFFVRFH